MTHFTRFSGFPARRAERGDAGHHKPGATLSGGPENLAFVVSKTRFQHDDVSKTRFQHDGVSKTRFQHDGGPNRPAGSVAMLVRYPASHGAPRLPGRTDLTHEMGHYLCTLVSAGPVESPAARVSRLILLPASRETCTVASRLCHIKQPQCENEKISNA